MSFFLSTLPTKPDRKLEAAESLRLGEVAGTIFADAFLDEIQPIVLDKWLKSYICSILLQKKGKD